MELVEGEMSWVEAGTLFSNTLYWINVKRNLLSFPYNIQPYIATINTTSFQNFHFCDNNIRNSFPKKICNKGFSKISQNSQENTCVENSFFNKVAVIEKETYAKVFFVNFAKFSRTTFS